MTEPKPMDPEVLTHLRELAAGNWRELLRAHDFWHDLAQHDDLASLVGNAIVRASLAPGERATSPAHALTAAVDELRARAERAEKQARLTHAEYLQAAPEERAMMEAGTADPLDVLREMHQRTVAELRARVAAVEAQRDTSAFDDAQVMARFHHALQDSSAECAELRARAERAEREIDDLMRADIEGEAPAWSSGEIRAAFVRAEPKRRELLRLYPDPQPEGAPLDCPFEHLGPCDAGDRGHHTHTVDGVVYAGAPSDVASKACDCPGGLLEHLFGCPPHACEDASSEHSLRTPFCDAPVLTRKDATWYQDEQANCPDCGDVATVNVSEDFGDDEPLTATLSMDAPSEGDL